MYQFSKDGKIIFPMFARENKAKQSEPKIRHIATEAYCPNGCSVISKEHEINGVFGLLLKFRRPGAQGELVLSAIEGDSDRILLSGELNNGEKNELYCPHCDAGFKKLVNCSCQPNAEMVVLGLTPKLNYNNAISLCNVSGCTGNAFVKSADVLRKCY
jgi:hypothetical protein